MKCFNSRIKATICVAGAVLLGLTGTAPTKAGTLNAEETALYLPQKAKRITGTIVDQTGYPAVGVNVIVKGTSLGTTTDSNGNFTINGAPTGGTLVISFLGFKTQEVTIGESDTYNVTIQEDTEMLDELVVVGYGVQKKITATGSVATVKGEALKASPTANVSNAIVGRLPGVIGYQRSDEPGQGGTTLRIRGTNTLGDNSPLVVIDGVAGRAGGLDRLNPSEIESISVLKDASAAIYGSRAANGVILVTTKRGKEGKPSVTYSGNFGISSATRLPSMCNAYQYATLVNEINTNSGGSPVYSEEDLKMFQDGSDPWGHPNTNWFEEGLKKVSPTYRHEVGLSGGAENVKYYLNVSANGEDGIYKNSANRYDQYSVRANIDAKVNKYIDISYSNVSRLEDRKNPTRNTYDIWQYFVRTKPTIPGYWPTGEVGPDLEGGNNPVVIGTDKTGYNQEKSYYIQNTAKVNVKIPWIEGLSISATGSYDKYFNMYKSFSKPWYLYSWDGSAEHKLTPVKKGPETPELTQKQYDQTSWMANALINYDRTFGNHSILATAGIEAEHGSQGYLSAFRKYFLSDALDDMDLGGQSEMNNGGNTYEWARMSYFGRLSYNYKERYIAEYIWRVDGSYKFPKDKRFGYFPGVSLAWRASDEDWWKEKLGFISYAKLRGSISQTGSDAISANQYLETYSTNIDYIFGGTYEKALQPSRTANPNVTWEVGTTYDLGLEAKSLDNRLSFEGDVFYHKRTKMLITRNASLPILSGITLPAENLGEMCNRGVEALISWKDRVRDFDYSASFNMTYAKNKILFWDETPGAPDYQLSTGHPTGTSLYYVYDGVFYDQAEVDATEAKWANARPGDIKFKDVNEDGKINADDRIRIDKSSEPRLVAGLTLNAAWRNFDISVLFQGSFGSVTYIFDNNSGESGNFFTSIYDNRWTAEIPSHDYPRVYNKGNQYWASNSNTYFLYNNDFVRLKNLEIGYNFNMPAIRQGGISNLRVYFNGSNLLTFSKIKIIDPEAGGNGYGYPLRRVLNFGATITF